jgi:hypothetical protein
MDASSDVTTNVRYDLLGRQLRVQDQLRAEMLPPSEKCGMLAAKIAGNRLGSPRESHIQGALLCDRSEK